MIRNKNYSIEELEDLDWKSDEQTVDKSGESVSDLIEGLKIKYLKSVEDRRGDLTEMFRLDWEIHPEPLVQAYQVVINSGAIRGWELHLEQDDRIFISKGKMRWLFYDTRKNSNTFKKTNDFVFSELNRALIIVPKGIVHAVKNIGTSDAIFINFPTKAYNHKKPDKIRPANTEDIPIEIKSDAGW